MTVRGTSHGIRPALGLALILSMAATARAVVGDFSTQSYNVGPSPTSVAIADLNGDGFPDLVVANQASNNVSILLGSWNGSVGTMPCPPVAGPPCSSVNFNFPIPARTDAKSYPISVAIGDLNGDGFPDLAVASEEANTDGTRAGGSAG